MRVHAMKFSLVSKFKNNCFTERCLSNKLEDGPFLTRSKWCSVLIHNSLREVHSLRFENNYILDIFVQSVHNISEKREDFRPTLSIQFYFQTSISTL